MYKEKPMQRRINKCEKIDVIVTNKKSEKLTMNSKWSSLAMREMDELWEGSLGSSIFGT